MIQEIKSSQYWKHPEVDMGIIELPRYQQTRRQIILYSLFSDLLCFHPLFPLFASQGTVFFFLLIYIQYSSSNRVKDTITIYWIPPTTVWTSPSELGISDLLWIRHGKRLAKAPWVRQPNSSRTKLTSYFMFRETAVRGDRTTVLGWHRGEGNLVVGEAQQVKIYF